MTARRAQLLHTTVNANPLFNLLRLSLLKMVLLFLTTRDQNTAIILPRAVFTVIQLIQRLNCPRTTRNYSSTDLNQQHQQVSVESQGAIDR